MQLTRRIRVFSGYSAWHVPAHPACRRGFPCGIPRTPEEAESSSRSVGHVGLDQGSNKNSTQHKRTKKTQLNTNAQTKGHTSCRCRRLCRCSCAEAWHGVEVHTASSEPARLVGRRQNAQTCPDVRSIFAAAEPTTEPAQTVKCQEHPPDMTRDGLGPKNGTSMVNFKCQTAGSGLL